MSLDHNKRKLLFPLIYSDVATGVNEYTEKPDFGNLELIVCYMHSDLNDGDEHRNDIEKKISSYDPKMITNVRKKTISRYADYSIAKSSWFDDVKSIQEKIDKGKVRIFDKNADIIESVEAARDIVDDGEVIILEEEQYEMQIGVNSDEVYGLLDVFEKNVFSCEFDKGTGSLMLDGDGHEVPRKEYIFNAWKVPVIVVCANNFNLADNIHGSYSKVRKMHVDGFENDINFFIGKKFGLAYNYLKKKMAPFRTEDAFSHVVFKHHMDDVRYIKNFENFKNIFGSLGSQSD